MLQDESQFTLLVYQDVCKQVPVNSTAYVLALKG